ncbi:type II CAAX endopeptidase family protein [Brucella pseudogrignonensis]|uniref:Membrane protease YdiL (CAAX protease family) n=1 Tax=Brucella pseudogrignonensis TaxID=419475 RepID=A0ABU1MF90_9HYPH|nr:type II CAAX endopeptidase family protein [Brucella pseudogrignonensis]MDR6434708.1 membrane protease YdiL (CAAX protease family) [Brucella pseudogrignonensis]
MDKDQIITIDQFKHPWLFFTLSTIAAWSAWIVAAWFSYSSIPSFLTMVLVSFFAGVGLLAPAIVTWAMLRQSTVLLSDFWIRLSIRWLQLRYILVGITIMMGSIVTAQFISLFFGYSIQQFSLSHSASFNAGILIGWVPLVLAPIVEEISWHGYGTDALRRRMSMLCTSIVFSIYWAIWHFPLAFIKGYYQANLVATGNIHALNFIISLFPFVIIMNWLYYRSGRSIWVAVVFHLSANIFNEIFQTHPDTKIIQTLLLIIITLALIAHDPDFFFGYKKFTRVKRKMAL